MDPFDDLPVYLAAMRSLKEEPLQEEEDAFPEEEQFLSADSGSGAYPEIPEEHPPPPSPFAALGSFLLLIFVLAVLVAVAFVTQFL